jgi:hypothetical protein
MFVLGSYNYAGLLGNLGKTRNTTRKIQALGKTRRYKTRG